MTAPDPGLTDLIAAHWTAHGVDPVGDFLACECGTHFSTPKLWAAHVALVVEQHTNGRITELEDGIMRAIHELIETRERAEKHEATIARVKALVQDDSGEWLPYWRATTSDLRAALEGEQQ